MQLVDFRLQHKAFRQIQRMALKAGEVGSEGSGGDNYVHDFASSHDLW
jgi:hypothetical protein